MVFFNGDRVCLLHSRTGKLEFGRILEYVEEPAKTGNEDDSAFFNLNQTGAADDVRCSLNGDFSPKRNLVKIPLASLLASPPRTCGIPGITSPMQQSHNSVLARGSVVETSEIKRQVIWDDNKGESQVQEAFGDSVYRVIDRRFTVGQRVLRDGVQGVVVEAKPLATVKITDGVANTNRCILPDVDMSDIHPISSLFTGVTVEYRGWIGQVSQVQRCAVYKLDDSTTFSRRFFDPTRNRAAIAAAASGTKKKDRFISKAFTYPFMPHAPEMPFEGKVVRFGRDELEQFRQEDEEDKENCQGYCSRSLGESTVSSPSPSSSSATAAALPDYVRNSPAMLCLAGRKKARAELRDSVFATVLSVSILGIKVRWTGRLPEYLIKASSGEKEKVAFPSASSTMPNSIIRGEEDIKLVRSLYINPSMYFDKKGLCIYNNTASCSSETRHHQNGLLAEKQWAAELFTSLESNNDNTGEESAPFNLSDITLTGSSTPTTSRKKDFLSNSDDNSTSGKRKRLQDDEDSDGASGKVVVVCKHFVRHKYKVIWETREETERKSCFTPQPSFLFGNQLEPDLSQEHKLCLGLIHSHLYVVAKKGSWMDGKWDYGVVAEKLADDSVVVEWLKIRDDGSVSTERILNCSLVEIDKHPRFNELHEGRIVVRGQAAAAKYSKLCGEFLFGTVVSVRRFSLGQISVYCPIQRKLVELWPHMLEVFEGMSMQEQIALKVVGLNKDNNWDANNNTAGSNNKPN